MIGQYQVFERSRIATTNSIQTKTKKHSSSIQSNVICRYRIVCYSLLTIDTDPTSWKEAFSLFDKRGNGKVTKDTLGDLLRAIGQNPTQAEVAEIEDQVRGDVDFDGFVKIVKRPDGFRPPGEPEDLVRGFQIFDKDNSGYIGVGELRYGRMLINNANHSIDIAW